MILTVIITCYRRVRILLIACLLLCCFKVVDEKTGGTYYWNQTTGRKPLLQYVLLDHLDWLLGVIHASRADCGAGLDHALHRSCCTSH